MQCISRWRAHVSLVERGERHAVDHVIVLPRQEEARGRDDVEAEWHGDHPEQRQQQPRQADRNLTPPVEVLVVGIIGEVLPHEGGGHALVSRAS